MTRYDRPSPAVLDPPPNLWDSVDPPEVIPVIDPPPGSIQEAFEQFDRDNPWVGEALRRLALDLVGRGRTKIGIGMLTEVVRWQWARDTNDQSSSFKINNNFRAPYARKLMAENPELAGAFETRKSETDAHFE